jgi:hypothetical protein
VNDRTWLDGDWQPTTGAPASGAAPEALLHEDAEAKLAPKVWASVFGALTLLCVAGLFLGEGWGLVSTGFGALVFGALAVLAWHTGRSSATRTVRWDAEGIVDQDMFRTRRIPWPAIARFERINSAARRQADYDHAARDHGAPRPKGFRPKSIWVWTAFAADGQTLLELIEPMQPPEAFEALKARIGLTIKELRAGVAGPMHATRPAHPRGSARSTPP